MPVIGEIELADIGDHRVGIDQVFLVHAMLHRCLAEGLDGLGVHHQPGELLAHVRLLDDAVVLGHQAGGPGEEFQLQGFVGLGAETVEVGEHVGHFARELPLPLEEDAVVRDEDVVEDDGGVVDVHGAGHRVVEQRHALVDLRLSADHGDTRRAQVDAEGHGVRGIVLLHGAARSDEHLVAGRGLADVGLRTGDDDAVGPLLNYTDVEVFVLHLLARPQTPVALDVGEAHGEGQIVLLQVLAIGLDVLGVAGAVLLVHPARHHGDGVEAVLGHELGAGRLPEADAGPQLDHLAEAEEVLGGALGLQREADAFAVLVENGEQILVARVARHDVVHGDPIVGDLADRVRGHVGDQFAVEVDDSPVFEALQILLWCLDSHGVPSPSAGFQARRCSPRDQCG